MLKGLLKCKCPSCNKGDMFPYSAYNLAKMAKMNTNCLECGQTFNPEPSFYVGAMYVSYAFSVTFILSVYIINILLGRIFTTLEVFLFAVIVVVSFAPMSYRLSRSIWARVFIRRKDSS